MLKDNLEKDKWLSHIVNKIDWDKDLETVKRYFSQKSKDANFNFKSVLACIIPIHFSNAFSKHEIEILQKKYRNKELKIINGEDLNSINHHPN